VLNRFYAGLDAGSTVSELVAIDEAGEQVAAFKFATGKRHMLNAIQEARRSHAGSWSLAVEEGELAQWIADELRGHVDRLVVCDPKRNAWIARDPGKQDRVDAKKLAQLLKGGFLAEVYHPSDSARVEFKRAVQHYHDMTRSQAGLKRQIKSRFRALGAIERGSKVFEKSGREQVIAQLASPTSQHLVRHLYELLDQTVKTQEKSRHLMLALGRAFPEVVRFQEVPGIGPVWACTFSAYIQTPHRFHSKRQLWRYCRLGITNRQSNGEPLGRQRLDNSGVGVLKALSYQAFCSAQKSDNEFHRHFEESLARTSNRTHARLSTQRKILTVLWTMWRRNEPYRPGGTEGQRTVEMNRAEAR
jgi:transposase